MDAYFIPQIREICERYRPDGLFFDTMGDAQPCPCDECRERFEAICGVGMDLLLAALELFDPNPLRVDAPGWVDANLMTVDGKLVLHLVQFCLNHGAGCEETFWHGHHYHLIEDVRPLFDIPFRVRTNRQPTAVTLVPSGGPLEFDYADGWVRAVLPRLDIHAAVCMAF